MWGWGKMGQYIFETLASSIIFITYINQGKRSKMNNVNFGRLCNKTNIQLPTAILLITACIDLKQENCVVELITQMCREEITLVSKCKQWLNERDGLHELFTGVQRKILMAVSHGKTEPD